MSKTSKFQERLCARPPPADIRWDDLQAFLEHLGYSTLKGAGSRRKFWHAGKAALIICHEPHPRRIVPKALVVDVVRHLRDNGFI